MFSRSLASFALAATFIASTQATCMHGTTLMRREEGAEIPVPVFSYSGETGPMNWASLDEGYKACRTSQQQSPLDLTSVISFAEAAPQIHWPNVDKAPFENLYTTLEVIVEGGLVFNNVTYTLKQFHFHTTSEHRINNEHYPLEAHFVSQAADESILVTAVLFDLSEDGSTTELLTSVTQNIAAVAEGGSTAETGPLNFGPIIDAVSTKMLYHYTGSLTTPPCKEGVQFLVVSEPLPLDVKTYKAIKKVIGFNARPTQNNPGGENLLELAKDQAVAEDGPESDGTDTTSPPVVGGDIDIAALIAAITATGAEVRVNTNSSTTIQVIKAPTDEEPPVDDPTGPPTGDEPISDEPMPPTDEPTETGTGEEPTETGTDGEEPTETETSTDLPEETTSTDAPEETDIPVINAPGPVDPVPARRSNLLRRRF